MGGQASRAELTGVLLASLAAVLLCLHHGRVGYMPLDQSIVFDGAFRVSIGQIPFRDFTTPSGVVPSVMQALWFRLFGVSWLVYCLHAAVANGLFVALVHGILRFVGLGVAPALAYALMSGVVFYPPFGVPYMDQHSFFFGAVFVGAALVAGGASSPRVRWWAMASMPWVAALGFLSKPVPAVLFLPVGIVPFLRGPRRRILGILLVSTGGLVAMVVVAGVLLGIDPRAAVDSLLLAPLSTGGPRASALLSLGPLASSLLDAQVHWGIVAVAMVHAAAVIGLGRLLTRRDPLSAATPWLLGEFLVLVGALAAALTKNDAENNAALAFVAVGLAQLYLIRLVKARRWAQSLAVALLALAATDAVRFDRRVNAPRLVHDVAPEDPTDKTRLPPRLTFLVPRLPHFYGYTPADLAALVRFLDTHPGNVFVLGDTSILYGLTGRPSANPALWFHPRLTLPRRQSPDYLEYQDRLCSNLERLRVRWVVIEPTGTFMGVHLVHLPRLREWIGAREVSRWTLGGFEIVEVLTQRPAP